MQTTTPEPRVEPVVVEAVETARTAEPLRDLVARIEGDPRLDDVAARLRPIAERLGSGPLGDALRGRWLGHALHPLMTDLPLGCWMSANLLDLVGGRRAHPAAQRLVGLGLLAVPPTVAAGLVDWHLIEDERVRRVGAAHAAGNSVVAASYFLSWRCRRKGHHLRGAAYGLAGGALALVTGYLGGHLSFGRGVGVGDRGVGGPPPSDEDRSPTG